jgi:hypothetical protein
MRAAARSTSKQSSSNEAVLSRSEKVRADQEVQAYSKPVWYVLGTPGTIARTTGGRAELECHVPYNATVALNSTCLRVQEVERVLHSTGRMIPKAGIP